MTGKDMTTPGMTGAEVPGSGHLGPVHLADSFHLEIDGVSAGSFVRVSGLGARTEVIEVAEGGCEQLHRLPGSTSFSSIILETGVTRDGELYEWFLKRDRRDGAIILLSTEGKEILRWRFRRGWPCRWEGPLLDADRAEVAVELLEIAHEGLEDVRGGLECERR